ncbi:S-Ena type endospore appendage [Vallitalea guaymasensis]|uniref:S-Ena type endospore appendage n=1 Tax=Vallitalea guaymasensis TaxID=1185412 RepID=UPI00272D802A|nr:S-Ena type endospore appendage [Vallitalea guaymasensis]
MCEENSVYVRAKCAKYYCEDNEDCCNENCILTDVICGTMYLNDNHYNVLWQAVEMNATITVKIDNKSEYPVKLIILGKRRSTINILPHQQTNVTVQDVHKLIVQRICKLQSNTDCKISYDIGIHYISNLHNPNKNKRYRRCIFNDRDDWLPISCICSAFK